MVITPCHHTCYRPWFACYVKSRHEKHVASLLAAKGYECFLPTYLKTSRKHKCELPLFPGYVFCKLDTTESVCIRSTSGLFSIVGSGSGPEPIPEEEIEAIRRMIAGGFGPRPWPYIAPGETIYIAEGPFRGLRGTMVSTNSDRWLVVSVRLLQRSVAVKLDRASLSGRVICPALDRTRPSISC
jgi:transcription antitermination factor NusG